MVRKAEVMSRERLDLYIAEAAKTAGYEAAGSVSQGVTLRNQIGG